jgi:hypothetical protein
VTRARTPELICGQHRRDDELEAWISKQLALRNLFQGLTNREIRRDRLTAVLVERGILDTHAGKMGGKSCTWRELTERLYGRKAA